MKKMAIIITALIAATLLRFPAQAAVQKLTKVSVTVKDVDRNGVGVVYDADIQSGSLTSVEDVEWSDWPEKPGKKVTATVTICPKDGYQFVTSGSKKTKVEVDGGSLASLSVKSKDELVCRINYTTKMTLSAVDPESIWIGEDGTTLHWDAVPYCSQYRVILSGGTNLKIKVWDATEVDLSKYITDNETDTKIQIQAIPKDNQVKYLNESATVTFGSSVSPFENNTASGVFEGELPYLRFRTRIDEAGVKYYAVGWQLIGKNSWYLFDKEGKHYARTGWQADGGKRYYLDPATAKMQTGWLCLSRKWYYLYPSGEMAMSAWIQDGGPNGSWYYVGADGVMLTDTVTPDGYKVGKDGKWIK